MTAGELIKKLQKLDPEQRVTIAIRTFTQAHDVAYTDVRLFEGSNVLFACLPEGFVVSERKKKS